MGAEGFMNISSRASARNGQRHEFAVVALRMRRGSQIIGYDHGFTRPDALTERLESRTE
jgi:hypothetical protein